MLYRSLTVFTFIISIQIAFSVEAQKLDQEALQRAVEFTQLYAEGVKKDLTIGPNGTRHLTIFFRDIPSSLEELDVKLIGQSEEYKFYRDQKGEIKVHKKTRAFHIAASSGDVDEVRRFLAEGMDVNAQNSQRETALHQALSEKRLKVAEILLEAGADPNIQDRLGNTPFHKATEPPSVTLQGRQGTLEEILIKIAATDMLLKAGGDIYKINKFGYSVLEFINQSSGIFITHEGPLGPILSRLGKVLALEKCY